MTQKILVEYESLWRVLREDREPIKLAFIGSEQPTARCSCV